MNEENRIEQIRRELAQLHSTRQQLLDQSRQEEMIQEMPSNTVDNGQGMANNQSKNMERGKTLTLSNGHSILGDNNKFNSGFINMVIMALLAGFATGVVATAVYIFMSLGKVTVSL